MDHWYTISNKDNEMKGYRTLLAALLTIFFGVLANMDWLSFLNDWKQGSVAILAGVLMALMRILTTTPVGYNQHPAEVEKPPVSNT
jgi:hypothetical protein